MTKTNQSVFQKIPWLSSLILFCTYAVFGWSTAVESGSWAKLIVEQGETFKFFWEEESLIFILHGLALVLIVFISLCLTAPVALVTFIVQKSLGSDFKAFLSVFFWSFLFVVIICFFDYFADILVIVSATILARLDLQKLGWREWQVFATILFLGCAAFIVGLLSFEWINGKP